MLRNLRSQSSLKLRSYSMEELVWRKAGEERCVRSVAADREVYHPQRDLRQNTPPYTNQAPPPHTPSTSPSTSPSPTQNTSPSTPHHIQEGVVGGHPLNKRESASAKINERYLVGQPIQNPFMPNSNYINDLEVQMNFLTPQKRPQD